MDPDNLNRISEELGACRGQGRLRVVALGKRAAWLFARLPQPPAFDLIGLPHPSAQGLLQAAPEKGKGLKLQDLRQEWERTLAAHLETGRTLNNS